MLGFQIWKAKAWILGAIRLAQLPKVNHKCVIGLCCSNGSGDLDYAKAMNATVFRADMGIYQNGMPPKQTWVLIPSENNTFSIASTIAAIDSSQEERPMFYAVGNERDDLTYSFIDEIRGYLRENRKRIIVTKGAHRACTEKAGSICYYEYLTGKRHLDSDTTAPHLLHFYLHPSWEKGNKFDNWKRKCLLTYIVTELKDRGVWYIIVDEAHDGSNTRPGYKPQVTDSGSPGEPVYASKEGWDEIVDLCTRLGVYSVHYYQASNLGYEGNTVI